MTRNNFHSLVLGLDKLERGVDCGSWLAVKPTGASPREGKCLSSSAITGSSQGSDVSLTTSSYWNAGSCLIILHGSGLKTTRTMYYAQDGKSQVRDTEH